MSKLRDKIAANGFTAQELLNLSRKYRALKKASPPTLTDELSLEDVIKNEARKSFSLIKYYIAAVVISVLVAFFFKRTDYLYMPVAFLILIVTDVYSSAKNGNRKITTELKLMLLAVKMRL